MLLRKLKRAVKNRHDDWQSMANLWTEEQIEKIKSRCHPPIVMPVEGKPLKAEKEMSWDGL